MSSPRHSYDRDLRAAMLASAVVGTVLCLVALAALAQLELPGRSPPPSPEAQDFLLLILSFLLYGIIPTLSLAFLLTARTIRRHLQRATHA